MKSYFIILFCCSVATLTRAQQSPTDLQAVRFCAASEDEMRLCLDMARLSQQGNNGPYNRRRKREAQQTLYAPNDRDRTQGGGGSAYDRDRVNSGNYFHGANSVNPVRNVMPGSAVNDRPLMGVQYGGAAAGIDNPQQRQAGWGMTPNNQNNILNPNSNPYSVNPNFNQNPSDNNNNYRPSGSGGFGSAMNFGKQIVCVRATDNYDCMKLIGEPDSQKRYTDIDQDLYAHVVLLGPAEAYIAVRNYGMTPIAVELVPETGQAQPNIIGTPQPFLARLVAVTTGDINSINDMRGKRFCYTKANDTLGWFLPNAVLERSGIISPPNACNSTYLDMVASSSGGACVPNTWQDYSDENAQRLRTKLCQCQGINCNVGSRFQYPTYTDAIRCLVQDINGKDVAFTTDVAIHDAYTMNIWPPSGARVNDNNNNYPINDPRRQQQQPPNANRPGGARDRSSYHLVCPVPDTATQRTYADLADDDQCNWGQLPTRVWLASQRLDRNTLLDLQSHIKRIFDGSTSRARNDPWFMQYFSPDYPRLTQSETGRKRAVGMNKLLMTQSDPQQLFQQYAGIAYPLLMENEFPTCSDKFKSGKIKWCTTSQLELEKCRIMMQAFKTIQMQPGLDCVRKASPRQCMQDLDTEMADLAVFEAADAYRAYFWYYLTPLMQERYGIEDSLYSVGVVRTGGSTYNNNNNDNYNRGGNNNQPPPPPRSDSRGSSAINSLQDLKDKRVCFSGFGDGAGWIRPMATLKNFDIIKGDSSWDFKDFAEAADRMFGPSCAPGANQDDTNPGHTGRTKLCQQCSTDSQFKCTRTADEVYSGPDGAINCLRDGAGDVAFLPHTGLLALGDEERNNYQLLCPGLGTRGSSNWQGVSTAPLMNYQSCNFGRVPAGFVMTSYKKPTSVRSLLIEYIMKAQEAFGQNPFVPRWQGGGGGGGFPVGGGGGQGGYSGGGGGGSGRSVVLPDDVLMSLYPGITPNSFSMFAPRNRTDNYARRNRDRLVVQQQMQRNFAGSDQALSIVPINTTYYGLFTMGTTELVPLPQPASLPAFIDANFHDDLILVDWDLHRNGAYRLLVSRLAVLSVAVFIVSLLASVQANIL